MSAWQFKKKIKVEGLTISADSRKFEYLVCDYLNDCFPLEKWKITPATNDGNRDVEEISSFMGKSMWAEAKYSIHNDKALSSRKYDSTLVSAKLENNIIKIFFVTNSVIGTSLIERVSSFCHLVRVDEVQFVEKSIIEYWITQHPIIQKRYFTVWNPKGIKQRFISLRTVRIFHKRDSYTIDTLLESQKIAPLYHNENYIFESEISIIGYEEEAFTLLCGDHVLHEGTIHSGIYTFNLTGILQNSIKQSLREYTLHFYYKEKGTTVSFGSYTIKLSSPIVFYIPQMNAFNYLNCQLKQNHQLIYNIYGKAHIGKSWLLKRMQEDLVCNHEDNSKTIHIMFKGSGQDILSLCRLIFTLIFDYYNLGISGDALNNYCMAISERDSVFSYDKISTLINALKQDKYMEAEALLLHCLELDDSLLFEYLDCFSWKKIYIIDNVHLLEGNAKKIFMNILESFRAQKQVVFIISSRFKLNVNSCINYELKGLEHSEVLSLLNKHLSETVENLEEILPDDHKLCYPLAMDLFLNEIGDVISPSGLRNYYANNFKNILTYYLRAEPSAFRWTAPLLVIFLVGAGVDSEILMEEEPQIYWADLMEQDIIVRSQGEFFANYIISDKKIKSSLQSYTKECERILLLLLKMDKKHSARYRNTLLKYYPEHYNTLWKKHFIEIQSNFEGNYYNEVRELCNVLLMNSNLFTGDALELRQVKYWQAFSYMHCNSSEEALPMLLSLLDEYRKIPADSLYYTIYSEIIDAQYWEWKNYNKMAADINSYRKSWKGNNDQMSESRAYLTATNRMMVYLLAEDKMSNAQKWMKKNLRLAEQFLSKEHVGYTLMDFAKGIYHVDLKLSLDYLEEAAKIFNTLENERRRFLDCKCEIAYIRVILGLSDMQVLKDASAKLYQNQYWIQYYKSKLKMVNIYLLNHNMADAKKYLTQSKNVSIISDSVRCQYFLSIFESIIGDENDSIQLGDMYIPNAYKKLLIHNKSAKKYTYQLYQKDKVADTFYLDPRIW